MYGGSSELVAATVAAVPLLLSIINSIAVRGEGQRGGLQLHEETFIWGAHEPQETWILDT